MGAVKNGKAPAPIGCTGVLSVLLAHTRIHSMLLLCCSLCGKFPFHSSNRMKLEELILIGELTFTEIEWTNVSQTGKPTMKSC